MECNNHLHPNNKIDCEPFGNVNINVIKNSNNLKDFNSCSSTITSLPEGMREREGGETDIIVGKQCKL